MKTSHDSPRVAWISGAAGGLGQALVAAFADQGWCVAASHHRAAAHGESAHVWPVACDVTDRAQVNEVAEKILARWGRVDVLVNNAGVTADGLSWQIAEADWDRVVAVNLTGAFLCSQAVTRAMIRQRDGQIVNVASFAARSGRAGQANYAAAKAGVIGLTESLARELGSRNVRVNAILPGVLPTPMTARLTSEQLDELTTANALGRLNDPAEVARFVAFLASLTNVSGQVFQLDSRIGRWT